MTFEQLLVKYLYQHKQISIQGFGTVTLNNTIPDLDMINKNRHMPVEGANFTYNTKAQTDENFVLFFAQQRGKIRPLAISDIESHLQLAKQLMNIGKPWEVEGLGMFAMQRDGSVVLIPGHYAVPMADNAGQHVRLRERTEQQEKTEAEATSGGVGATTRKVLLATAIIIALGVAGWFIWSQFANQATTVGDNATALSAPDSLVDQSQPVIVPLQDSTTAPQVPGSDTILWRAYFRSFTGKDRVENMQRLYHGNGIVLTDTPDSVNFRLYVLVNSTVSDTAAKVDSLSRVFLRPVTLERVIQ